jgi:tartrate-resistant acid phosphatase type 5
MRSLLVVLAALVLAAAADNSISFLVMGDWGGQPTAPYTTPAEVATAKSMGVIAEKVNAQFVLALGDNFYDAGLPN